MNRNLILAALLCGATMSPALAQNIQGQGQTSESNSGAAANSGSVSGASSDNNATNNNAGIGSSHNVNESTSSSGAISGSASESTSNSNGNTQGQAQTSSNEQGQDQGQMQGQDQSQNLDANQANQQGVTVNQTWNTKNRRQTEVRTNNAVPLAASSSFSSDYCGGTVSGGVSAAPIGISLGASGTRYDKSCQSLRRAEKFGMAAANAHNMGQPDLAGRLMSMMIWSICTSDTGGTDADRDTATACNKLLLLGSDRSLASAVPAQPLPTKVKEARVAANGQVTPVAAQRASSVTGTTTMASIDEKAAASAPK
jgi:hypothetical protein